jgi:hypothetical protein
MGYYFLVISFFLIIGSKRFTFRGRTFYDYGVQHEALIFVLAAIFLCGGYMTGSDWRAYEFQYNNATWDNLRFYKKEQLFYVLMIFSKRLIPNFFIFLIICKFIVFHIFIKFFRDYSVNQFFAYFFFIPIFGLFLFIDNPLRYMIALGCLVLSFKYLLQNSFKNFIILVLLGSLFHITVLIFIPFYFIRINNIPRPILALLYLVWSFFFSTKNLLLLINFLGRYIPTLNQRLSTYLLQSSEIEKIFSLGLLMYLVFFFWVLLNKNNIENNIKNGRLFYSMTILFLFFMKFGVIFPTGFRIGYMFGPFFIVTLTYLFQFYDYNWKQLFSLGVAVYILLITFKRIDSQFVYLPYSNYFYHVAIGETYDYAYRSNVNIENFIKRKGHHPKDK